MARSTNILLACAAMLGAMLLAIALEPRNLMARTHEVFNIEQHLPKQFGEWKPVEGLNVMQSGRATNHQFVSSPESAHEQVSVPFDVVVTGNYSLKIYVN